MHLKHLQEFTRIDEAVSGHGFFQEAEQYAKPGDFTDEFYDLLMQITKMKKVMKNPRWLSYMQVSDQRLDTSTAQPAVDAIKAISALEKALTTIDQQFDAVNGTSSDDSPPDDADSDPAVDPDEVDDTGDGTDTDDDTDVDA